MLYYLISNHIPASLGPQACRGYIFKCRNVYTTQAPLEVVHSIDDSCCMIWKFKSKVMVSLRPALEEKDGVKRTDSYIYSDDLKNTGILPSCQAWVPVNCNIISTCNFLCK